jgi:uncharacterized low-complexity protein
MHTSDIQNYPYMCPNGTTIRLFIISSKIHEDSCGNARNVRRNKPRASEGCGLQRARGKQSGFFRYRKPILCIRATYGTTPICVQMAQLLGYLLYPVKIHEGSCGNARNVRRNKPRASEGCGLQRARGKRSGFFRYRK